ncbi:MAG: hypothetical protein C4548_05585 [Desulfobacteraceae bacterium]|jgi:cytochrome c553|nr:MAG: hypothetical protein C4548_05585 [Desulfobacteraceae bacterium]
MRRIWILLIAVAFVCGGLACFAIAQEAPKKSDNWLKDAADDAERFTLIEKMFGGFSGAMQIVGERYLRTYDAITDGNFDLANYHWKKIKDAIELGYLRRPARKAHADALFLNGPWRSAEEAILSKDKGKASAEAFLTARAACMTCHAAEQVAFMNDQPMFRNTAAFPER